MYKLFIQYFSILKKAQKENLLLLLYNSSPQYDILASIKELLFYFS